MAFGLSVWTFAHQYGEHSDRLTYQVIRDAYSDFIKLDDIRAKYPLQGHLFETPKNYQRYRELVAAAVPREKNAVPHEHARLLLEEAAMAVRVFSMFEHSWYQWDHAKRNADPSRVKFLREVLDYYTGRILCNPRLLWYWSADGANLSEHFEPLTIDFYNQHVKPAGKKVDSAGPFSTRNTSSPVNWE